MAAKNDLKSPSAYVLRAADASPVSLTPPVRAAAEAGQTEFDFLTDKTYDRILPKSQKGTTSFQLRFKVLSIQAVYIDSGGVKSSVLAGEHEGHS